MIAEPNSHKARSQSRSFLLLFAGLAAAFLGLSLPACASSIVPDGGFEAAGGGNVYFAGQSIDGGSWNVTQGAVFIDTQDPYVRSGNNSLNLTLANLYVPNSIAVVLNTVAGQKYQVDFRANADTSNLFSATVNGAAVSGGPSTIVQNGFPGATNGALFQDYFFRFIAGSTSTTLTFTATGEPVIGSQDGSVMIDDVSTVSTPEPGSIVLTFTGLVSLLAGRKRLAKPFSGS